MKYMCGFYFVKKKSGVDMSGNYIFPDCIYCVHLALKCFSGMRDLKISYNVNVHFNP